MKSDKEKMDARLFKSKEFDERIEAIEIRLERLKKSLEEIKEQQRKFK